MQDPSHAKPSDACGYNGCMNIDTGVQIVNKWYFLKSFALIFGTMMTAFMLDAMLMHYRTSQWTNTQSYSPWCDCVSRTILSSSQVDLRSIGRSQFWSQKSLLFLKEFLSAGQRGPYAKRNVQDLFSTENKQFFRGLFIHRIRYLQNMYRISMIEVLLITLVQQL